MTSSDSTIATFRGADGLSLTADEWNHPTTTDGFDASQPSVLMLHGGGQNRFSWKKTGQVLASRGLHVVALDSRGHGDSDRSPDARYTVEALCADTRRVLEQIGRPTVLIGASMGGLTGILAAREAGPDTVTRLVLVDVVPRYEKDGSARIRDFMFSHVHGFGSLDEAADAVAAYLPHRRRPSNPEGLKKNLRHRNGRWYWHWDPAFIRASADETRASLVDRDRLESAARGVKVPTLLVRGRVSDLLSEQGAQELLTLVPQAQYVDVAGAGHMVAGDRNDLFTNAVVEFLESVRPG
jgi:pimeloyl-ACP methyl ester carboxylesterase